MMIDWLSIARNIVKNENIIGINLKLTRRQIISIYGIFDLNFKQYEIRNSVNINLDDILSVKTIIEILSANLFFYLLTLIRDCTTFYNLKENIKLGLYKHTTDYFILVSDLIPKACKDKHFHIIDLSKKRTEKIITEEDYKIAFDDYIKILTSFTTQQDRDIWSKEVENNMIPAIEYLLCARFGSKLDILVN